MDGRSLLVSDLDGTLLGDDQALEQFCRWHAAHGGPLRLVYNSGRLFDSTQEVIRATALPEPDAVICAVGTEIRCLPSGKRLSGWPPRTDGWDAGKVRAILADDPKLQLQPEPFQSGCKVSYYAHGVSAEFLKQLRGRLESASLRVGIVYSSNRDLDILPADADKGSAAAFLAKAWGLASDQVIVSGDTGNDLAMFRQGFRGIVVANAHPELHALTGPLVYHARQPFAAGVVEGMQYWLSRGNENTSLPLTPGPPRRSGRGAGHGTPG